jgi:putative transposase
VDYQWFADLTNKGVSFVTRLRSGAVYEVIEQQNTNSDKGILTDQTICFTSVHAKKRNAPTLRLIRFLDFETGRIYRFLTNNFKLSASTT